MKCPTALALVVLSVLALPFTGCVAQTLGTVLEGTESLSAGPILNAEGASLRGLAVPEPGVVWASGSHGVVLRSHDAGLTFHRVDPVPDSTLDFRMLVALDARHAWVGSAGPGDESRLFETLDGGESWRERLVNQDPEGFWDALAFWDEANGLLVGDAVDGYLSILRTGDGGATWWRVPEARLPASPSLMLKAAAGVEPEVIGEVCFAASNRSLALGTDGRAWIATGGSVARVWRTDDGGATWEAAETPVRHGDPAAGIFAVAFRGSERGVVVGGKFDAPEDSADSAAWSEDGGRTWHPAYRRPGGYRSAVASVEVPGEAGTPTVRGWLAVGTSGASFADADGREWTDLELGPLNAVAVEPGGGRAYAVGPKANFAVILLR